MTMMMTAIEPQSRLLVKQDSKVSKGCAVLIELETLRNTKELSVFNDIFSL